MLFTFVLLPAPEMALESPCRERGDQEKAENPDCAADVNHFVAYSLNARSGNKSGFVTPIVRP